MSLSLHLRLLNLKHTSFSFSHQFLVIPLGTHQKCRQMLQSIGFERIEIATEQFGFYLKDAENSWTGNAKSAFGLQDVQWSEQQWEQCKQEYFAQVEAISTEQGFWNDITMFFVVGYKFQKSGSSIS